MQTTKNNRTLTVEAKNFLITLASQQIYRELRKKQINIETCKDILTDIDLISQDSPTLNTAIKYLKKFNPSVK